MKSQFIIGFSLGLLMLWLSIRMIDERERAGEQKTEAALSSVTFLSLEVVYCHSFFF